MKTWAFLWVALCVWTHSATANNDGTLCLQAEGYFDRLYEDVFQKQEYNVELMSVYKHYVNIHNHCKTGERKDNYITLISNIITERDVEPVIEDQLKVREDYKKIMLFLEGISENLYNIWKKKEHACGTVETTNLLKLNRLGNLFSQLSQQTKCESCHETFRKMEQRMPKVYICSDDALWHGE